MKLPRLLLPAFVMIVFLPVGAACQELPQVPASEASRHVIKRVEPVYPPMAYIANIQGRVTIGATITETGDVTDLRAVSGHPLLIQAAMDAVKQWKYQPFVAGDKPTEVRTTLNVIFVLGPAAEKQQKYYSQEIDCQDLLQASRYAEAEVVCNESVKSAAGLPNDLLKSRAYGNAGNAAYNLHKAQVALEDFQGQLKFAKSALSKDSAEFAAIYHNLARAYQATGHLAEADADYTESEKVQQEEIKARERKLGKHPPPQDIQWTSRLKATLSKTLTEHASLLRQMGKTASAEELDQRASALSAEH